MESTVDSVSEFNEMDSFKEDDPLSQNQVDHSSSSYASMFLKACFVFILIWIVIILLCQRDCLSLP